MVVIGFGKTFDMATTGEEAMQAFGDAMYNVKVKGKDERRLFDTVSREGVTA